MANVLNGFANGVFEVIIQLYLMTLGYGSIDLGSIFMMSPMAMLILTVPAGVIARAEKTPFLPHFLFYIS